jgi:hypothetical protein
MISLSDKQLEIVMATAAKLPVEKRALLLERIAARLRLVGPRFNTDDVERAVHLAQHNLSFATSRDAGETPGITHHGLPYGLGFRPDRVEQGDHEVLHIGVAVSGRLPQGPDHFRRELNRDCGCGLAPRGTARLNVIREGHENDPRPSTASAAPAPDQASPTRAGTGR